MLDQVNVQINAPAAAQLGKAQGFGLSKFSKPQLEINSDLSNHN